MLKKFSNITQVPNVEIVGKSIYDGGKMHCLCIKATISGYETDDDFGRTIFKVGLGNLDTDATLSLYKLNIINDDNFTNITPDSIRSYFDPIFSKINVVEHTEVLPYDIDITKFVQDARTGTSFTIYFAVLCMILDSYLVFGFQDTSTCEVLVGEMYNKNRQSYLHEKIGQDVGFVGKGSLDLVNGKLTFNMLNLATSGKSPVSIKATYNENRIGVFGEHITADFEYRIIKKSKWLLIYDSIGDEYYYEAISRDNAKARYGIEPYTTWGDLFVNLTDFSYALSLGNHVHLINKDKSIIKFFNPNLSYGNLVDLIITQIVTPKTTIDYSRNSSSQIINIKSNANDEIKLTYTNGIVSRIDYDKMRYVTFVHQIVSGKRLFTIKYCENNNPTQSEIIREIASYEFSPISPYLLTLAYDNRTKQGYRYDYIDGKVNKVSSIVTNSSELGGYINIVKSASKTVTTNHLGEECNYFFDNYGKCYLVSDKYGNSAAVNYSNGDIGTVPLNLGQSNTARNEDNILSNPFFEGNIFNSSFKWVKETHSIGSAISALGYNGKPSLRIYDITSEYQITQSITNPGNYSYKKLSFRGYIRGNGTIGISIKIGNDEFGKMISIDNTWEEVNIEDINVPYEPSSIDVVIKISEGSDVRLSNFFLCIGDKPLRQNFLVNGNFLSSIDGWIFNAYDHFITNASASLPLKNIFTQAIQIVGNLDNIKEMKQIINLSGCAGEELLFSLFGKVDLSMNDLCETYIEVQYQSMGSKIYNFTFNSYVKDYQLCSNSIITESAYNKVTVGLRYRSGKLAKFSGFGLYKEKYGTYYNYNTKKNLMEISSGENALNLDVNNESRVERIVDATGELYTYQYNGKNNITNISDLSGNKFEFEYDKNDFLSKKKIITRNNKEMVSEQTTDETGNVLTMRNFEGQLSSYDYDDKGRIIVANTPSGLVYHNQYDDNNNLTKMTADLENFSIVHNYTYENDNNFRNISIENGALYDVKQYDEWGNPRKILLDNVACVEYAYYRNNSIYTGLPLSKIYPNSSYTFSYDSLNRVTDVKYNNILKANFKYDLTNNMIRNEDNEGITDYFYNLERKLIKKSTENDQNHNISLYDYDNLGNIQQSSIELIESNTSRILNHNFVYDYEYNEYTTGGYFSRLDLNFQEDVIFEKPEGLHGANPVLKTAIPEIDLESGRKVFRFTKNTSSLAYNINSVNQTRTDKNYGNNFFNKDEWNKTFTTFKEMFIWVRLVSLTSTTASTKLISMGDDNNEIASVSVTNIGEMSFSYNGQTIGNVGIKPGEWSLIGIGLEQTETGTKLYSNVNESFVSRSLSGKRVGIITRILLGEYRNVNETNSQLSGGSNLLMPFDVLYTGIGAYKHDSGSFKGIYNEGYKYIFQKVVNPATGVIYYNPEAYKDLDVIPLNGSLISAKGLKPIEHTYIDSSFKLNKAKLFELDRKRSEDDETYTNRHIYGSYGENVGLDEKSKSLLTYDFGLQKQGTLSLRFKCNYIKSGTSNSIRTIFCCPSPTSGAHKLVVWINNQTQTIMVGINGNTISTPLTVRPETWHLFTMTWNTDGAEIKLDQYSYGTTMSIDLTGCKTYIGSNVLNGIPNNHLMGNIEMLSYSDSLLSNIHATLSSKGKLISVLTEYDEAQRPFKKEIDTGIKRLSYHYKYYDEDLKIRQVPDMEILPDGTSIVYSYDRAGNIVHQVRTKNGAVGESIHYRYDASGRLLSEKVYNGSMFVYCYEYRYDNNGNITFKIEYKSNGTIKSKNTYVYSPTVKDQLLRIESSNAVGTITDPQYINYNANDPFRPSNYKNNTLSWEGRRLTGYGNFTYQYNSDGIRISKNVNNLTTSFVLEGSKIIKEVKPNHVVYYHYDNEGMLTGFNYNGDEYFYIRSITGNIEKVLDSNGNIRVEYKYDAWGNVLSITGDGIKDVNNFLYKGYYYDFETSLYYCISRYYDPAIGRWISADDVSYLEPKNINGLNLYAYCYNNPIRGSDPDGNMPKWAKWAIAGIVAVGVVALAVCTAGAIIAAAPTIAGYLWTAAIAYTGSISLAVTAATVVSIGAATLAVGTIAIGVNEGVAAISGRNFGIELLGEDAYNCVSTVIGLGSMVYIYGGFTLPYPSSAKGAVYNEKEQHSIAVSEMFPGENPIIKDLGDPRHPGWLGWTKYSDTYESSDCLGNVIRYQVHYVGNRFFPSWYPLSPWFDFKVSYGS